MGDSEAANLVIVWTVVVISLCYCFAVGKATRKSKFRLTAVVPVIGLFFFIPLKLSSVNLGGLTSFFITWLASFKLLLFAFDQGPLASQTSSLRRFLAVACLPIKIKRDPSFPTASLKGSGPSGDPQIGDTYPHEDREKEPPKGTVISRSAITYGVKGLIWALITNLFAFRDHMHPTITNCLYCIHIYLGLEMNLMLAAVAMKKTLGVELEPQFHEPYMSTSLQDFWGHRWNLMVTGILRPTVYLPLLRRSAAILGGRWAPIPAVLGTFLVSALMHEIIFYHLGRLKPTWDITCFFVLHGICLVLEITVKKLYGTRLRRLPRFISAVFTMSFVIATVQWLFMPQLLRLEADRRALQEYAAAMAFLKGFFIRLSNATSFQRDGRLTV